MLAARQLGSRVTGPLRRSLRLGIWDCQRWPFSREGSDELVGWVFALQGIQNELFNVWTIRSVPG
jgi:hypothetical protein